MPCSATLCACNRGLAFAVDSRHQADSPCALEVARHGNAALKQLPDLPSVRKGNVPAAKELPGWNVSGGNWADMDALTEEEMAEQELAGETYDFTEERDACCQLCFGKSNASALLVSFP